MSSVVSMAMLLSASIYSILISQIDGDTQSYNIRFHSDLTFEEDYMQWNNGTMYWDLTFTRLS